MLCPPKKYWTNPIIFVYFNESNHYMCNYIVQRIEQFVITLYFKRHVGYNFQIKIYEIILRVTI